MKRNTFLAFIFGVVIFSLTACSTSSKITSGSITETVSSTSTHEHSYNSSWSYNEVYHWHDASCGHSVISDREEHTFNNEVVKPTYSSSGYTIHTCTVCGYSYKDSETEELTHRYDDAWSYNESSHWHACIDSGYEQLKAEESSHYFESIVTEPTYSSSGYTTHTCTVCGYSYIDSETEQLTHNYEEAWSFNESTHWHTCIDSGYEYLKADESSHSFNNVVTDPTYSSGGYTTHTCSVCGYSYRDSQTEQLVHHYEDKWSHDESTHWHACIDDGYESLKADESSHSFTNTVTDPTYSSSGYTTHTCSVCGYSYNDSLVDPLSITITWVNYDGTVLEVDENVAYGSMPSYDGMTPTKPNYDVYKYEFSGWSPEVSLATCSARYTATFNEFRIGVRVTVNYCLYNLKDQKAITYYTVLPSEIGEASQTAIYDFNSNVDLYAKMNEGYTFLGWYYQNTLLSNYSNYNYVVWDDDVEIIARFCYSSYTINIHTNNPDNGLVLLRYSYTRSATIIDDQGTSITIRTITETITNTENREFYETQYDYKSEVSIAAYSKTNVRFLGWYDEDNNLVSTNAVYSFAMPNRDYTLEAKWDFFSISYDLNGGTNNLTNPTSYTSESGNIELLAPTRNGYTFIGWKYKNNIISSINSQWLENLSLEAVWEVTSFEITYELYGGTNNSDNPSFYTIENDTIALLEPSNNGYTFGGWYKESTFENPISKIESGSYGDLTIYAKWNTITYSITYNLDGGENNQDNQSLYTVEDTITLLEPTKPGYNFVGWYLNNEKIESISAGTTGDIILTAVWEVKLNLLSITSSDETKGTVKLISGEGYTDELIKISATPAYGYYFMGWFDSSDSLVSKETTYEFNMPTSDYSLKAIFCDSQEAEDLLAAESDKYLTYTVDGDHAYVSGFSGATTLTNIYIRHYYQGLPVTSISTMYNIISTYNYLGKHYEYYKYTTILARSIINNIFVPNTITTLPFAAFLDIKGSIYTDVNKDSIPKGWDSGYSVVSIKGEWQTKTWPGSGGHASQTSYTNLSYTYAKLFYNQDIASLVSACNFY